MSTRTSMGHMPEDLLIPAERIAKVILFLRGHKVLLDEDLAKLYGVSTKRLNEQVRRNRKRFPPDFMFELTDEESLALRSQIATLKRGEDATANTFPSPLPNREWPCSPAFSEATELFKLTSQSCAHLCS